MATVTFPIELGGSGLVVSDDTDPTTGLRNGGYLTRFLPALQQTVAVAGFVVGQVSNAAASASAAAGSASAASSSASSAASSAASAATLYDQFDDRYLGPKASNPTVDNDGNALLVGAMYFNTAALETRVWNGTTWQSAATVGGVVNSLTVTGALEYQGTLTGGTGVINIGSGQLVKDTAGNLGLGVTPSAWGTAFRVLQVGATGSVFARAEGVESVTISTNYVNNSGPKYIISGFSSAYDQFNGSHIWSTAPSGTAGNPITFTQAMTLTNGGNLLVGTTSNDSFGLNLNRAGGSQFRFNFDRASFENIYGFLQHTGDSGGVEIGNINNSVDQSIRFSNGSSFAGRTERARVTSGGYFKASNTGSYTAPDGADRVGLDRHHFQNDQNAVVCSFVSTNTGAGVGVVSSELGSGAAGFLYNGTTGGVEVYRVLASGSVENATNSYGAISDPKLKDIIGPKSSTWEKTKQYNWIEYYLKSDTEHTFKMLGLNAEEAQAISPGVVDESPDLVEVTKVRQVPVQIVRLDENENPMVDEESGEVLYDEVMVDEEYTEWEPNGEFTKSVKYSVVSMQYHRTTQECQQRIESLEAAKVQADDLIQQIMARVAALESASA